MVSEEMYQKYFTCLIRGDRKQCAEIVQDLLDSGPEIRLLYTDLFQRSLYQVGDLWEKGKVSVAVEHLATSLTESLMNLSYPYLFSRERCGKSAVISCVANETHQIGGKMAADILELNGWDTFFLGANTPVSDLSHMLQEKEPDVVGLSLSLFFRMPDLMSAVETVRALRPEQRILVGGQAFRWGGRETLENIEGISYIASVHELETFIHRE